MASGSQDHRRHLLEKAKLAPPSARRRRSEVKVKKNFLCPECQKAFNSLEKLKVHSYSHTGERPYRCSHPDCTKAFVSKYKLLRHMATHSPEKNHKCSYCEKMFHRKDHLKNHLHTHDPHKEAFTCQECGKSYNTKLGFKRHIALHAANSGDLTCQVCLQLFPSTAVLLEHLKTHSGKSSGGTKEKKHCCEHCERCFYTRKDVRRHMVVHTGRKDFLCQYCAQRFGRKDHLTRHVKKSHARELLRVKTEPTDLQGSGIDLPLGSIKGELLGMLTPKSHQPNACPGLAVDPQPFFSPNQPFSLKYPLGPNITSYSPPSHQREQALKGELETFLMEFQSSTPSSSSATQEPQRSFTKPEMPAESVLNESNEEEALSKMSTLAAVTTGDSPASSSPLMDFTQLFSFLPYSQVAGSSGIVVASQLNEEPTHLAQLSSQPPTSPDASENPLQGMPSPFLSAMSTPTTLPRFHQAFQ
ncbi:Zinc finger protein PLAG1 [Oryzias melastigma]|uniref:Pleiomorphic adenoma gene 1 n=2 Tax=Oryzias melastigma TaxID=30732 RepID=A0A3B3DDD0_ORYME|nr:zinc finger protein PLAG1 isoform X1 [Oryzias melastigma]XP_024117506.1 zinc finger protein PLAG1 isoform X1 [Oryzias melastigma]KAF6722131.1 Zinc finger protein PLAG1 [Oryzias melastigma]